MATFYSSFFSSGLASLPHEHAPLSSSPSTPRQSQATLAESDVFAPDPDTTPTANEFSSHRSPPGDVLPSVPAERTNDTRPTLRRRRSSLSSATSPLSSIKTGTAPRAARQSLFVARARSGSDASGHLRGENATERNSLVGRMRSGSVGGAAMRGLRRMSRKPAPPLPAPPPTAPLPAPPSRVNGSVPSIFPLPSIATPQAPCTPPQRRPLARRAHTTDNTNLHGTLLSPMRTPYLTPDEEMEYAMPSSPGYEPAIARCGRENQFGMQVDYPSPVDGDREFNWDRNDSMKEN
ncbi:uncharacterized protein FIBRA_01517 [Fibroporia radiculosa]|uniref:Uncharacterized protein n=1 Tax=Fibroporia radiculosa TaxID=599839 RepID=J4H176_9APHY|nr:uncharacterized protein FIBRA_01517 [Fibroporia radiculosa]CCL99499.1 predicted protein [Fibroporia radiculosa]